MKPVAFEYARPATVGEACRLLAKDGNARVIAGGQTLIPMLAMRLARPSCLVDIARIPELSGIRDEGTFVAIGAATRQVVAERDPLVARKVPLLAKALPWVGHAPTRNRGTIGGSVANGDPAAEIALVAVTLDATLVVQTAEETSELAAAEFYLGPMITALPEGGILTSVHFPGLDRGPHRQRLPRGGGAQERLCAGRSGGAGRAGCRRPLHGARRRIGRSGRYSGAPGRCRRSLGRLAIGGRCGARGRRSRHCRTGHR